MKLIENPEYNSKKLLGALLHDCSLFILNFETTITFAILEIPMVMTNIKREVHQRL